MRRTGALLALFSALAVLHTWPLATNLSGLSRLDNDDAGLNIFIVSWIAHILPSHPLALFHAPMFFPEPYTLAYSEHMVVPSLMGAPLLWAGVSPIAVYNLLILAGFALSGWSMAIVVQHWTSSTTAGILSGTLFAFNAHLLTRLVHLQALHLEFFPVALLALDSLLRTRASSAPSASSAASASSASSAPSAPSAASAASVLSASSVAQALCSNYTLVFLAVALVVAAIARANEWLWPVSRGKVTALFLAGLVAVGVIAPFLWPYYLVSREQGLTRSLEEVGLYSAGWRDYLATGGRLHYEWWSHRWFEGRTALFPGVAASLIAIGAIVDRETRRDPRTRMMLAMGLVGTALSFGPALPGYGWIHTHVPLFEGLRAAARWGLLPLTAIAVIAGFGVAVWQRRWGHHPYWTAASVLIVAVPTLEALRAPMAFVGVPSVPAIYDGLRNLPAAVLVEWPIYSGPSVSENARYLFHSTRHFQPMVNGYSGFEPESFRQRASRWRAFPDVEVIDEMARLGVTHLALHTQDVPPAQAAAASASARLQRLAEGDGVVLYRLIP